MVGPQPQHIFGHGPEALAPHERRPWQWPGALRRWLVERRLGTMGAAAAAALTAGLLFALGSLLRLPCNSDGCPAYAGVPAALLETIGIVALLIGLAATGTWIAGITQRTWIERLRLQRVEVELQDEPDEGRLRRLDAILGDASQVPAIQVQARLYLWAGLPPGVLAALLLPFALGTFGEAEEPAAYVLPAILLAFVAGTAAVVRGLSLGAAARRLTRPLRAENPAPDRAKTSRKHRQLEV